MKNAVLQLITNVVDLHYFLRVLLLRHPILSLEGICYLEEKHFSVDLQVF